MEEMHQEYDPPAGRYINLLVTDAIRRIIVPVEQGTGDADRSERIDQVCRSFSKMVEEAVPLLSLEEWTGIVSAHIGMLVTDMPADAAALGRTLVLANVEEGTSINHGYKQAGLIERINGMTLAQKISIIEIVMRVQATNCLDISDVLRLNGVKLID